MRKNSTLPQSLAYPPPFPSAHPVPARSVNAASEPSQEEQQPAEVIVTRVYLNGLMAIPRLPRLAPEPSKDYRTLLPQSGLEATDGRSAAGASG